METGPNKQNSATNDDDLSKFKIMVVDDDPGITSYMSAILKKNNFHCTSFNDPVLALHDFLKNPYHLLITDLSMPGIDGYKLIKRLRTERPSCSIIIVTANKSLETVSRSQRSGASYIMFKPLEPDEIIQAAQVMYRRNQYWHDQAKSLNGQL